METAKTNAGIIGNESRRPPTPWRGSISGGFFVAQGQGGSGFGLGRSDSLLRFERGHGYGKAVYR